MFNIRPCMHAENNWLLDLDSTQHLSVPTQLITNLPPSVFFVTKYCTTHSSRE